MDFSTSSSNSSDSSSSSTENEDNTNHSRKKAPARHPDIVVNLAYCKYRIVEQVASRTLGFSVVKNQAKNWDIMWSDSVVST